MKKNLQLILSLLCVLALAFGGISTAAAEAMEARVITVLWQDGDNFDNLRTDIKAKLGDNEPVTLTKENGWTCADEIPAGTAADWQIAAPEGYTSGTPKTENGITTVTFYRTVPTTTDVQASIVWEDGNDAEQIRPKAAQIMLYADGEPYGEPKFGAATVEWKGLPSRKPGETKAIIYSVKPVKDPDGYTSTADGKTVTFTLKTVNVTINATIAGAPADADLSNLKLVVDGPDISMPKTLTYADVAGGYKLENVLPGAYLVRDINADTLVEGYIMDKDNSNVCDAAYIKEGSGTLNWKYTYKEPTPYEEEEGYDKEEYENYDPTANVGSLSFQILGPDSRMPMTITYKDFTDGKYDKLTDLQPGSYTVVERNAEKLVKYYVLTSDSVTAFALAVTPGGTSTATLKNIYVPATTPEPEAEFVDIPVTKTWSDNNNKDGNRPESITVRLYADGVEVDSHVVTAGESWKYTFTERPRYKEDHKTEIVYSVKEDAVPMYTTEINGYNLINHYLPEVTSSTVVKVWDDSNNASKHRPESIVMTLKIKDGAKVTSVTLNQSNGWTATVNDLPTIVNGKKAEYEWKEQEVLGYKLREAKQVGNTWTFTNVSNETPPTGNTKGVTKTRKKTTEEIEDYKTPLGVNVIINHVGDCFD